MSQHAHSIASAPTVGEQLLLNRLLVAAAEEAPLQEDLHPARWERRGLLQRLCRRE